MHRCTMHALTTHPQHSVTCTLTTVFSACSIVGLTAVSAWFASERWAFSRHHGTKWLADILSETKVRVKSTRGIKWLIYEPRALAWSASRWVRTQFRELREAVSELSSRTLSRLSTPSNEKLPDPERAVTPNPISMTPEPNSPTVQRRAASDAGPLLPIAEHASPTVTSFDGGDGDGTASIMSESTSPLQDSGKGRFAHAVRAVMKMRAASSVFPISGKNPRRQRTMSSDGQGREAEPVGVLKNSRVGTLMPKLKSLHPTQSFEAHSALVRHLQFSPNGKFLATSRWVLWHPCGSTLLRCLSVGIARR